MKLKDLVGRPVQAGRARIRFKNRKIPYRDQSLIVLPKDSKMEFYFLKDGQQFLCRLSRVFLRDGGAGHYFGGTDEHAVFLTGIKAEAFQVFQNSGEKSFYEELRPRSLRILEEQWGGKILRQGDWFFYPLPSSYRWEEATDLWGFGKIWGVKEPPPYCHSNLEWTRHIVRGQCVQFFVGAMIKGMVLAPDHPTLCLLDTIYFAVRANHLIDPNRNPSLAD